MLHATCMEFFYYSPVSLIHTPPSGFRVFGLYCGAITLFDTLDANDE